MRTGDGLSRSIFEDQCVGMHRTGVGGELLSISESVARVNPSSILFRASAFSRCSSPVAVKSRCTTVQLHREASCSAQSEPSLSGCGSRLLAIEGGGEETTTPERCCSCGGAVFGSAQEQLDAGGIPTTRLSCKPWEGLGLAPFSTSLSSSDGVIHIDRSEPDGESAGRLVFWDMQPSVGSALQRANCAHVAGSFAA